MIKTRGFTMIEMLVVIGIIAIALPAIFAIIFAIFRQQARVYALKQVKREGDFALNIIENQIRNNAEGIYTNSSLSNEVCDRAGLGDNPYTNSGTNFYFEDKFGNWFRYSLDQNAISSASAIANTVALTTSSVQITNLSLTCNRSAAYATPLINISFDVSYSSTQFQEQIANLHYQVQIEMKNY